MEEGSYTVLRTLLSFSNLKGANLVVAFIPSECSIIFITYNIEVEFNSEEILITTTRALLYWSIGTARSTEKSFKVFVRR
jgi:hypothetical protein